MRWFTLIFVSTIVILDEIVKYWALTSAPLIETIANPGIFTLAIHKNWGIAFNIPFKLPLIILTSLILGIILLRVAYTQWKKKPMVALFALLILIGAAGNMFDRLVYGYTVDYLVLFGRSAINLSDLVILTGVFGMLTHARKTRTSIDETPEIA